MELILGTKEINHAHSLEFLEQFELFHTNTIIHMLKYNLCICFVGDSLWKNTKCQDT